MKPKHIAVLMAATDWDTSGYICLGPPRLRVPPTPEDQVVIKRNLERVLRWCKDSGNSNPMAVVHRWCGDYLHP